MNLGVVKFSNFIKLEKVAEGSDLSSRYFPSKTNRTKTSKFISRKLMRLQSFWMQMHHQLWTKRRVYKSIVWNFNLFIVLSWIFWCSLSEVTSIFVFFSNRAYSIALFNWYPLVEISTCIRIYQWVAQASFVRSPWLLWTLVRNKAPFVASMCRFHQATFNLQ